MKLTKFGGVGDIYAQWHCLWIDRNYVISYTYLNRKSVFK